MVTTLLMAERATTTWTAATATTPTSAARATVRIQCTTAAPTSLLELKRRQVYSRCQSSGCPRHLCPGLDDVKLTIDSTGDTLTILQQNFEFVLGPFFDIKEFRFDDGTVWTNSDIRLKILAQAETAGDDTIYGFFSADTLDGGGGNDLLIGRGGGDTYIFGRGYGHDVINANIEVYSRDKPDRVVFHSDIAPSDLSLSRIGQTDDLLINVNGTDDQLIVEQQFYRSY